MNIDKVRKTKPTSAFLIEKQTHDLLISQPKTFLFSVEPNRRDGENFINPAPIRGIQQNSNALTELGIRTNSEIINKRLLVIF